MKIMTSFFYRIRFFKPNMIPMSTALWDQKWFHDGKGPNHIFIDKNGIYNGLRILPLVPKNHDPNLDCGSNNCSKNPPNCNYLINYRKQLDSINFDEFMNLLEIKAKELLEKRGIYEEPIVVFIVYEVPQEKCSERIVIQSWLRDNGVDVKEFFK